VIPAFVLLILRHVGRPAATPAAKSGAPRSRGVGDQRVREGVAG
jgi:hypothetical protein